MHKRVWRLRPWRPSPVGTSAQAVEDFLKKDPQRKQESGSLTAAIDVSLLETPLALDRDTAELPSLENRALRLETDMRQVYLALWQASTGALELHSWVPMRMAFTAARLRRRQLELLRKKLELLKKQLELLEVEERWPPYVVSYVKMTLQASKEFDFALAFLLDRLSPSTRPWNAREFNFRSVRDNFQHELCALEAQGLQAALRVEECKRRVAQCSDELEQWRQSQRASNGAEQARRGGATTRYRLFGKVMAVGIATLASRRQPCSDRAPLSQSQRAIPLSLQLLQVQSKLKIAEAEHDAISTAVSGLKLTIECEYGQTPRTRQLR